MIKDIKNKAAAVLMTIVLILSMAVVFNTVSADYTEYATKTPGITIFQDGDSNVGDIPLDTDTEDLYYGRTITIEINKTAGWTAESEYFLYKPIYEGYLGSPDPYNLRWERVPIIFFEGDGVDPKLTNVLLDVAGLWVIDNDSPTDADFSSAANMNTTVPAWFWVNTSTVYNVDSSSYDASFPFDSAGYFELAVTEDGSDVDNIIFDIRANFGNGTSVMPDFTNIVRSNGSGRVYKNADYFWAVGDYSIYAYYDLDNSGNTTYYFEPNMDNTDARYFNETYGSNAAGNGRAATWDWHPSTTYNYPTCGPWDPPEANATIEHITVTIGKPTIKIVPSENSTIYHCHKSRIDFNVTLADGTGLVGATMKLKKLGSDTFYEAGDITNLSMWETGDGNYSMSIDRAVYEWTSVFTAGAWYMYFTKETGGDTDDEYNNSKLFTVSSTDPPVRLIILDDGHGVKTDKKIDAIAPTSNDGPAGYVEIIFRIDGRTCTGHQAVYGDDDGAPYFENGANISIKGNILYTPNEDDGTLRYDATNETWHAMVVPTIPDGSITISIDWEDEGKDSETIYIINASMITSNIEMFEYGDDGLVITATIEDKWGYPVRKGLVYLFYDDGDGLNYDPLDAMSSYDGSNLNQTTGNGLAGRGQNGQYSFIVLKEDMGDFAPRNIIIAASDLPTVDGFWGYAKVEMQKSHTIKVNCSPGFTHAGNSTLYDFTVSSNDEDGYPSELALGIYDEDDEITEYRWPSTDYTTWTSVNSQADDEEVVLAGGPNKQYTYQVYAFNATHDSKGYNATIIVEKYIVTSTPSILAWLIDTETNMTFQVSPPGTGTLTIHNMSSAPNCSWLDMDNAISVIDGIGTLENVNATDRGNLTFSYQPEEGLSKKAEGMVKITSATAVSDPPTIYIEEPTAVWITLTHPATGAVIPMVDVGLDLGYTGAGDLAFTVLSRIPEEKKTGTDGRVKFDVVSEAAGNVTIYIKGETDPTNPQVIESKARRSMILSVDKTIVTEGETFTVSAKSIGGILITDVTVEILFNGVTYTTDTGTLELTSPMISGGSSFQPYMITANAEGYTIDATIQIQVTNIPNIYISVESETIPTNQEFTVLVEADDGTKVGISVTFNGETKVSGPSGVKFTSPSVDTETDYTITAERDGYLAATAVTITVQPTPGFELLTLIVAIGVAFILLRRRRR